MLEDVILQHYKHEMTMVLKLNIIAMQQKHSIQYSIQSTFSINNIFIIANAAFHSLNIQQNELQHNELHNKLHPIIQHKPYIKHNELQQNAAAHSEYMQNNDIQNNDCHSHCHSSMAHT